jgi:hypothetical protein
MILGHKDKIGVCGIGKSGYIAPVNIHLFENQHFQTLFLFSATVLWFHRCFQSMFSLLDLPPQVPQPMDRGGVVPIVT